MMVQDKLDLGHEVLTARPVSAKDVAGLHALALAVGWSHRPEDIGLLVSLGKGYVVCDARDDVLGSALWFPLGEASATIGMVITSPRLRGKGAGRWLMQLLLRDTDGREVSLNATAQGLRLYQQLGFEPTGIGHLRQGVAQTPPVVALKAGNRLRAMRAEDLPAMAALDRGASGQQRDLVIDALLGVSEGVVLEDALGAVAGFAMTRAFGQVQLLGPMVARDDADAVALAREIIAAHVGRPVRIDTLHVEGAFAAFLERCGLPVAGDMTVMWRARLARPEGAVAPYAMVSQALG